MIVHSRLPVLLFLLVAILPARGAGPSAKEAIALTRAGKLPEALAMFDALVAAHPEHAKLRLMRAKVAFRAGNVDLAVKDLESLAKHAEVGAQATALLARIRAKYASASPAPASPVPASVSPSTVPASPVAPSPSPDPSVSPAAGGPAIDYGASVWKLGMSLEEFKAAVAKTGEDGGILDEVKSPRADDGAEVMLKIKQMEFLGKVVGEPRFAFDAGGKLIGAHFQDTDGLREEIETRSTELLELLTFAYGPPHADTLRKEGTSGQVKYWTEWSLWSFPGVPAVLMTIQDPEQAPEPNHGEVQVLFGTHPSGDPEIDAKLAELRARPPLPPESR